MYQRTDGNLVTVSIRLLALVVLALVWSACRRGGNASPAAGGRSSTTSLVHESASDTICPTFLTKGETAARNESSGTALLRRGHKAGASESLTAAILGPPLERRASFDSLRDTVVRLRYRGLQVVFYKNSDPADGVREFLAGLTLTSPHCEVVPGLSVGASAANLFRLFGAPTVQEAVGDSLRLQFQEGERGPVDSYMNFMVLRDTIRTIQWQFGVD
jgi:hypothetical protein